MSHAADNVRARRPQRAAESLQRYHITQEQKRQLDKHWFKRVADDSELRATFERASQAYRAWLVGAPKRG